MSFILGQVVPESNDVLWRKLVDAAASPLVTFWIGCRQLVDHCLPSEFQDWYRAADQEAIFTAVRISENPQLAESALTEFRIRFQREPDSCITIHLASRFQTFILAPMCLHQVAAEVERVLKIRRQT